MHVEQHAEDARPPLDDQGADLDETLAVAGCFGLAGRCLEEEMDRALLRVIRTELPEALADAGWRLDTDLLERPEDELLEALAEEFTGLFVAPGGVSPFASVFETGCMYREPCDRATEAYREAGWDYSRRMSGEFPDHIGTMLGFFGRLAAVEAEARLRGDAASTALALRRREVFLLQQLGPWAPGWCRRASQAALLPFYRQLLEFTEQILWQELSIVTDRRGLKELAVLNRREPKKLDYDADFRKASGL